MKNLSKPEDFGYSPYMFPKEMEPRELYNHVLGLWVNPEIERRKTAGQIDEDFQMNLVQILFVSGHHPIIRFNQEIRGKIIAKFGGQSLEFKGDQINSDIQSIEKVSLDENEANCGYLVMIKNGDKCSIKFDGRINKKIAITKYNIGLEFLEASNLCKQNEFYYPAIDNLFSALELFVTSHLMVVSNHKYSVKQTHQWTQSKYFQFLSWGNHKPEFKRLYTDMYNLRDKTRYKNKDIDESTKKEFEKCMEIVKEIRDHARNFIF
jgi:pterin-4a-carbinolamine dehydratase